MGRLTRAGLWARLLWTLTIGLVVAIMTMSAVIFFSAPTLTVLGGTAVGTGYLYYNYRPVLKTWVDDEQNYTRLELTYNFLVRVWNICMDIGTFIISLWDLFVPLAYIAWGPLTYVVSVLGDLIIDDACLPALFIMLLHLLVAVLEVLLEAFSVLLWSFTRFIDVAGLDIQTLLDAFASVPTCSAETGVDASYEMQCPDMTPLIEPFAALLRFVIRVLELFLEFFIVVFPDFMRLVLPPVLAAVKAILVAVRAVLGLFMDSGLLNVLILAINTFVTHMSTMFTHNCLAISRMTKFVCAYTQKLALNLPAAVDSLKQIMCRIIGAFRMDTSLLVSNFPTEPPVFESSTPAAAAGDENKGTMRRAPRYIAPSSRHRLATPAFVGRSSRTSASTLAASVRTMRSAAHRLRGIEDAIFGEVRSYATDYARTVFAETRTYLEVVINELKGMVNGLLSGVYGLTDILESTVQTALSTMFDAILAGMNAAGLSADCGAMAFLDVSFLQGAASWDCGALANMCGENDTSLWDIVTLFATFNSIKTALANSVSAIATIQNTVSLIHAYIDLYILPGAEIASLLLDDSGDIITFATNVAALAVPFGEAVETLFEETDTSFLATIPNFAVSGAAASMGELCPRDCVPGCCPVPPCSPMKNRVCGVNPSNCTGHVEFGATRDLPEGGAFEAYVLGVARMGSYGKQWAPPTSEQVRTVVDLMMADRTFRVPLHVWRDTGKTLQGRHAEMERAAKIAYHVHNQWVLMMGGPTGASEPRKRPERFRSSAKPQRPAPEAPTVMYNIRATLKSLAQNRTRAQPVDWGTFLNHSAWRDLHHAWDYMTTGGALLDRLQNGSWANLTTDLRTRMRARSAGDDISYAGTLFDIGGTCHATLADPYKCCTSLYDTYACCRGLPGCVPPFTEFLKMDQMPDARYLYNASACPDFRGTMYFLTWIRMGTSAAIEDAIDASPAPLAAVLDAAFGWLRFDGNVQPHYVGFCSVLNVFMPVCLGCALFLLWIFWASWGRWFGNVIDGTIALAVHSDVQDALSLKSDPVKMRAAFLEYELETKQGLHVD